MNTQPQPRFKFGDRLKHKAGKIFTVSSIQFKILSRDYVYSGFDALAVYDEKDLTLVREPLKVEFECVWPEIYQMHCEAMLLAEEKFRGKRTRVTITEIMEET